MNEIPVERKKEIEEPFRAMASLWMQLYWHHLDGTPCDLSHIDPGNDYIKELENGIKTDSVLDGYRDVVRTIITTKKELNEKRPDWRPARVVIPSLPGVSRNSHEIVIRISAESTLLEYEIIGPISWRALMLKCSTGKEICYLLKRENKQRMLTPWSNEEIGRYLCEYPPHKSHAGEMHVSRLLERAELKLAKRWFGHLLHAAYEQEGRILAAS